MKAEQLNMSKKIYEPYLDLLRAICNSDPDEMKRKSVIAVYDVLDNEKLIAIFSNSKNCAKFFSSNKKTIDSYISKGTIRTKRYKIERIYFIDENTIK